MDLDSILQDGTVKEIREKVMPNFHKIKHTVSFNILLNRLGKMSADLKEAQTYIKVAENTADKNYLLEEQIKAIKSILGGQ